MKIKKLTILITILAGALLLSACAGSAAGNLSWPGFTTDTQNNIAYLANGTHVYAIDLSSTVSSGDAKDPTPKYNQKWRFPAAPDNKVTFYAAPVLTEDGQLLAASYDNQLYSLDPNTGTLNWTFDGAENKLLTSPLVNGGKIFLPSSDYNLYALDLNGKLLWQYTTGNALWATPVSDGQLVYQPSMDHHIYALDAESGDLVWKTDDLDAPIAGQPTLSPEGILYAGTFNKELLAIDTQNGSVLWKQPLQGWGWSGPVLQDGVLYFGDLEGYIYAKNAADGSDIGQPSQPPAQSGQKATERAIPERPLVLDGKVYYASEIGSVYAADTQAGNPMAFFTLPGGKLYTGPQSAGELILIASFGTRQPLIAVDSTGRVIAEFVPPK